MDALQLLSRIANSRTLKDAFDPPYRGTPLESFTFGPNGITDLLTRERVSFSIEVDVELSETVIDAVHRQIHDQDMEEYQERQMEGLQLQRYHWFRKSI